MVRPENEVTTKYSEQYYRDGQSYYSRLNREGHWHWQNTESRINARVNLTPPQGGELGWDCGCPMPITHELVETNGQARPGVRLAELHRTW